MKETNKRAGEGSIGTTLADPNLVPSTHVKQLAITWNSNSRGLGFSSDLLSHPYWDDAVPPSPRIIVRRVFKSQQFREIK